MIKTRQTEDGCAYVEVSNALGDARVALQGAHLFHYQRKGDKPLLWLSERSLFQDGKAIRGGIPICWPWFGSHPKHTHLPQHGFARTSLFELLASRELDDCATELVLQLQDTEATRKLWDHSFNLQVLITVGRTLAIALCMKNKDETPLTISSALHTYFAVSDIGNVRVEGLVGLDYFDNLTGQTNRQSDDVTINSEFDRVYQGVVSPLVLHDRERVVQIQPEGSGSAVVWNPWQEKSDTMSDMTSDGYKTMCCVETANARQDARVIAPGETHILKVVLGTNEVKESRRTISF